MNVLYSLKRKTIFFILALFAFYLYFHNALGLYYFHLAIVNQCGKDVTIVTTHPDAKYHRFMIRNSENYQINTAYSVNKTIYITAFDGMLPIHIDGKSYYLKVSASRLQDTRTYYICSGEFQIYKKPLFEYPF